MLTDTRLHSSWLQFPRLLNYQGRTSRFQQKVLGRQQFRGSRSVCLFVTITTAPSGRWHSHACRLVLYTLLTDVLHFPRCLLNLSPIYTMLKIAQPKCFDIFEPKIILMSFKRLQKTPNVTRWKKIKIYIFNNQKNYWTQFVVFLYTRILPI